MVQLQFVRWASFGRMVSQQNRIDEANYGAARSNRFYENRSFQRTRTEIQEFLNQLKLANPSAKVFFYRGFNYVGGFVGEGGEADTVLSSYGENIFLHDSAGTRFQGTKWHNTLIYHGNPDWISYLVSKLQGGNLDLFDGIFADNCNGHQWWATYPGIVSCPVEYAPYSKTSPCFSTRYAQDKADLITAVYAALGVPIVGNAGPFRGQGGDGWWTMGKPPYNEWDAIFPALIATGVGGGNMSEGLFIDYKATFPSEADWKLNVDMIADIQTLFPNLEYWITDRFFSRDGTSGLGEQGLLYALASMILGIQDFTKAYLWLEDMSKPYPVLANYEQYFNMQLGAPQGTYYKDDDGLYKRLFSEATVIVNPTDATLGGVAPHSGQIIGGTPPSPANLVVDAKAKGVPKPTPFTIESL